MIMNNLEVSAKIPIFADGNLKRKKKKKKQ